MPGRAPVRGLVGSFHLKTVEAGPVEGREQKTVKDGVPGKGGRVRGGGRGVR